MYSVYSTFKHKAHKDYTGLPVYIKPKFKKSMMKEISGTRAN